MKIQSGLDIDGIVANNIIRLRGTEGRKALAARLNDQTGGNWSASRILDIEGRRKGRPPSPTRWFELVDLAIAFDVPIYELVLPQNHDIEIATGMPTKEADGQLLGMVHSVTTDEFAVLMFRLPSELLTGDQLAHAAESLGYVSRSIEIERQREAITWELADLITKIEELNKTEDNT